MRPSPVVSRKSRPLLRVGILLAIALTMCAVAAAQLLSVYRQTPQLQAETLRGKDQSAAFRGNRATETRATADGIVLANIGSLFAASLFDRSASDHFLPEAEKRAIQIGSGQLARLQLAAFRMRHLELTDAPQEQWWPALRPYLEGLKSADLHHHLADCIEHYTAVYVSLGLSPGAARQCAYTRLADPHGPFLEYFAERLARMEHYLALTDADAAAQCRAVRRMLLKQWVLEPGPAGARLLAADLLARGLRGSSAQSQPATGASLAANLEDWRQTYRHAAGARVLPFAPLSVGYLPSASPEDEDRALRGLALAGFAACAAAAALILATASAIAALLLRSTFAKATAEERGWRSIVTAGLVTAIFCVAIGILWLQMFPGTVRDDFRRDWEDLGWPRLPFVAAITAVAALVPVAWIGMRRTFAFGAGTARTANSASAACALLSLIAVGFGIYARAAIENYDRAMIRVVADPVGALCGPQADKLLDPLREWNP